MHPACVAVRHEPCLISVGRQAVLLARLEAQDQLESVLEHLSDEMHKSLQVAAFTLCPPSYTPKFMITAVAEPVHVGNFNACAMMRMRCRIIRSDLYRCADKTAVQSG